jgi:hypothetical protein
MGKTAIKAKSLAFPFEDTKIRVTSRVTKKLQLYQNILT